MSYLGDRVVAVMASAPDSPWTIERVTEAMARNETPLIGSYLHALHANAYVGLVDAVERGLATRHGEPGHFTWTLS